MKRCRTWAMATAVCVLLMAVVAQGQTRKQGNARSVDSPLMGSRSVEPDSPSTGSIGAAGPQGNSTISATIVPRLMKFTGALHDATGKPLSGAVDVTFALYSTEAGGSPLWFETQSVQADELGRYTALLGAMHTDGLPLDLFTSGEVRWLGIQVGLEVEQPRVLLVSVPYALKAGDAETLGGKPASAYMLSDVQNASTSSGTTVSATGTATTTGSGKNQLSRTANTSPLTVACASVTSIAGGAINSIPKFTAACNVETSVITQSGSNVGIGTTSPGSTLHMVGNNSTLTISGTGTHQVNIVGATGGRLGQDAVGFFFSSDTNGAPIRFATNNGAAHEWMRITSAGNVGIGTSTPAAQLDVQGGSTAINASGTTFGVYGTGVNAGIYGTSTSASGNGVWGYNPNHTGVFGDGVPGLWGHSGTGTAIFGQGGAYGVQVFATGTGVYGEGAGDAGVWGNHNSGGKGVYGTSTGTGVYGAGNNYGIYGTSSAGTGVYGNGSSYGVYGNAGTSQIGVYGIASLGYGVYGQGDNGVRGEVTGGDTTGTGVAGIGGSSGDGVYGQGSNHGVYSAGPFAASGSKSAVVALPDNRVVELYSVESPSVWFEDFGSASLKNGVAEVTLDPTFALTVNTEMEYLVFLTPGGNCKGLYVSQKSPGSFQVRELQDGKGNIRFDYRIVAQRRGFENVRLQEVDADPEAVSAVRAQNHSRTTRPRIVVPKKTETLQAKR